MPWGSIATLSDYYHIPHLVILCKKIIEITFFGSCVSVPKKNNKALERRVATSVRVYEGLCQMHSGSAFFIFFSGDKSSRPSMTRFYVLDSKILILHQHAVLLCFWGYCEKNKTTGEMVSLDLKNNFRCYVMKPRRADSRFYRSSIDSQSYYFVDSTHWLKCLQQHVKGQKQDHKTKDRNTHPLEQLK